MKAMELPGCCGLRVVHDIDILGQTNAYGRRARERFNDLPITGIVRGENCAATIVTITDKNLVLFKEQRKFLRSKGYKLLGKWQPEHAYYRDYTTYLYGSEAFIGGRK